MRTLPSSTKSPTLAIRPPMMLGSSSTSMTTVLPVNFSRVWRRRSWVASSRKMAVFTLARLTFGPEIGYQFRLADGSTVEPLVGIEGLWDIDGDTGTVVNGEIVGGNDVRAKVHAGATFSSPAGYTMKATGAIDGIGDDDFSAYSGQLWVNMPLN